MPSHSKTGIPTKLFNKEKVNHKNINKVTKDNHENDNNEKKLFQSAVKGIKPLTQTKVNAPRHSPHTPHKNTKNQDNNLNKSPNLPEIDDFFFVDDNSQAAVRGDDYLFFARPGIQHKILRKLRHGQYNVEAILDLHGQSVEQARSLLNDFLKRCLQRGIKNALIIHGKGLSNPEPILKNKLNQWLRQSENILAFCSATPKDGQRGALYLYLKTLKHDE